MCHSDSSQPPAPPDPGEIAHQGPLELTAADGNRFNAFHAVPAERNGRNIVILPDIRGLHPFYEALAGRFAQAGFHVTAFDYFGRTVGTGNRDDDFNWRPHIEQVTAEHVSADAAAAADHVRAANQGPTFTVGFCFGGGHSWRLAASTLPLRGVIGFYGLASLTKDVVDQFNKPALFLLGGADEATPAEEFHALRERLNARGKEFEMTTYEGAPHSFFDRSFDEWREACDDAWRRILDFTEYHSRVA